MDKLVVVGDSFCRNTFYCNGENKSFWIDELKNEKLEIIVDAYPSRDVQTIIDNWIKIIPSLKKEDYLIICLPYFKRTRLPFDESSYYEINSKKYEIRLVNRFVGTSSYNNQNDSLEFWGKSNDWSFYYKNLQYQELINSSKAAQKNYIEIIESLYKLTIANTYIFSWDDMEIKSPLIEDKVFLMNKLETWETQNDAYKSTNGLEGMEGDFHWSFRMNRIFANYVKERFINSI